MARRATESTTLSPLEIEMEKINREFGVGSVISSSSHQEKVDVISTGSLTLDLATGIGGLPRSKVVEIMGWESSGKSTITLQTIANAQSMGLKCLLVDGENSFDQTYAKALGIDVDALLIEQLDEGGGEKCYNIAERLMRTREIGVVVFDSQTALLPKAAFDKEIGDSKMGLHSRLMSESVPKIVTAAGIGNTLVIYISQFREKIGVMFGSPETTNGGNALKFYSHMRIECRKSVEREDGIAFANKTKCKIIKNKLAPPFKEAEFRIVFGRGVDKNKEILELGVTTGVINLAGSWYSYGNDKLGQGEDTVLQLLLDNEDLRNQIEGEVLTKIKQI